MSDFIKIKDNPNLIRLVDSIKAFNIGVPFYIAGGSVFSTLNGSKFNDIDIYFYSEEDYKTANKFFSDIVQKAKEDREDISNKFHINISPYLLHQTINSLSISGFTDHPIQLICKNFGEPEYILKGFDLYNSMCCITDDYFGIKHKKCYNNTLAVNFDIINFQTLQRSFKYIETKHCKDTTEQIKKLITFIVENAFKST